MSKVVIAALESSLISHEIELNTAKYEYSRHKNDRLNYEKRIITLTHNINELKQAIKQYEGEKE